MQTMCWKRWKQDDFFCLPNSVFVGQTFFFVRMFNRGWERVCVFRTTLMARTHIVLGYSSDDIKPGRKPISLYQSQQVHIAEAGARRWAQIFAQAGKLGSWVGAWERVEESRCNRETRGAAGRSNKCSRQQVTVATGTLNQLGDRWGACVCDCLFWGNSVLTRFWKLTDVEHLPWVTASKSPLIVTDHLENNWAEQRPLVQDKHGEKKHAFDDLLRYSGCQIFSEDTSSSKGPKSGWNLNCISL